VPEFRADDRVLLLHIPAADSIALLARILSRGVLVALGTDEEVDRARQAFADFDNVMFVEASSGTIPWRDSFFTKVIGEKTPEVLRVLAPGGEVSEPSNP
jgi:hypothetical protein